MLQPAMISVHWYQKNPQAAVNAVLQFECIQSALKILYNYAVYHRMIVPLENLPIEEKRRLWNTVKNTPFDRKRKIIICEDLYALKEVADAL